MLGKVQKKQYIGQYLLTKLLIKINDIHLWLRETGGEGMLHANI